MTLAVHDLPHAIAGLNALSVLCLSAGYIFIRRGDKARHRAAMVAALAASAAFLVVYVLYKLNSGFAKFGGEGAIRTVYFVILFVHVVGAALLVPLVPTLLWRALSEQFDRHRRLARFTWPLWMFVGVSGVVVYVMAIHLFPYRG